MPTYKVVAAEVTIGEEIFLQDEQVQMDPKDEVVKAAIEKGDLVLVPETLYTVVKGPIANLRGEVFQVGNDVAFLEGDALGETFLKDGMIVVKGSEVMQKNEETIAAPVTANDTSNTEPRKRYRGLVVVSENIRTVGAQSFNHIALEDGSEMDLTEKEYAHEVHVSYPSQQ